ncbi:hypothetical protein [Rhodopirellula bahusiensis]|nr:hypothetical protein [Rhodopirellula bahusiensis]
MSEVDALIGESQTIVPVERSVAGSRVSLAGAPSELRVDARWGSSGLR